ncbi:MAG TPA: GNAT family N-acetyltransferase [Vicinamibacterales bacterium]|nr:GNAT family N-acetyltransferase [Vicinamibacterales bacterium]
MLATAVRCGDWRTAPDALIDQLIATESRGWLDDLGWDVRASWAVLAPARKAGVLHGFIVRDDAGLVLGWTCFLVHQGIAQVAILVAARPDVTQALVGAILGSKAAQKATGCTFFVRSAPGLARCLGSRAFDVETYRYRSLALHATAPADGRVRSWRDEDDRRLPSLLQRAYLDSEDLRPFATGGTLDEWRVYAGQLLAQSDCGVFRRDLSTIVDGNHGDLGGAAVLTELGPRTVHLAQIAVDPEARGRGIARELLSACAGTAAGTGASTLTLLVAESNRPAGALYDSLGFRDMASFVLAMRRPAPDRDG